MAEILAASNAIGIASSLITFSDAAWRVVKRVKEYNDSKADVPESLKHITVQLPLLIEKVNALKQASSNGSPIVPKSPLAVALVTCSEEITRMDKISSKLLPDTKDSTFRKVKKAFRSITCEKDIAKSWSVLQEYVSTFTFHLTGIEAAINEAGDGNARPSFMIPFPRDCDFVERPAIFEEINQRFQSTTRVALTGIGGIGKSQIAIEYCYRFREENPDGHVFWIHSNNTERFRQAYDDIARRNRISGWNKSNNDTLQLVCEWMNELDQKWLVILDNADNLDTFCKGEEDMDIISNTSATSLINYIPKSSKGMVLITTRDSQVADLLTNGKLPLNIPFLSHMEAQTMLRSKISERAWSEAESDLLLRELEYLPLAITQAAAFIRQNLISLKDYLEMLQQKDATTTELLSREIPDPQRDSKTQNSIFRTLKLSFDQIMAQDLYAAEILSLMAMLDRHSVPTILLKKEEKGVVEFTAALGKLQAFSIINADTNGTGFGMHRLVQLSVRNWLDVQEQLSYWKEQALGIIDEQLPSAYNENWKTSELLNPHAQAVLAYSDVSGTSLVQFATILTRIADYEQSIGRVVSSRVKLLQALETLQSELGEQHRYTLNAKYLLAITHFNEGEYEKAVALDTQVVEARTQILGDEHEETLDAKYSLARTYTSIGKAREAVQLLVPMLKAQKRKAGEENPLTLVFMKGLARAYAEMHEHRNAALDMYHQVANLRKRVLGINHPYTLISMNDLACHYALLGLYPKAAEIFEEVIEAQTQALDVLSFEVVCSKQQLADVYFSLCRYEEAIKLHNEVVEATRQLVGESHPHTLESMYDLAVAHFKLGEIEEATKLCEKVIKSYNGMLSESESPGIFCVNTVASAYNILAQYEESIKLRKRVVEARRQELGESDLDTLRSKYDLACSHYFLCDYEEAADFCKQVIECLKETSNESLPISLSSMDLLASIYSKWSQNEEATKLLKKIVEVRTQMLGESNPITQQSIALLNEITGTSSDIGQSQK